MQGKWEIPGRMPCVIGTIEALVYRGAHVTERGPFDGHHRLGGSGYSRRRDGPIRRYLAIGLFLESRVDLEQWPKRSRKIPNASGLTFFFFYNMLSLQPSTFMMNLLRYSLAMPAYGSLPRSAPSRIPISRLPPPLANSIIKWSALAVPKKKKHLPSSPLSAWSPKPS
jgi:hypothetical protein